ncbi:MAG TPA: NAD-dependent epimerase/dehydratase family protein [Azospirillaceae bacterium]|nr:NAD-dependent epimerase/dehydratase family protein [Azospirillaceae bacterium]
MNDSAASVVRNPEDPAFWRERRVMITGGLGFIGSTLARRLAELGADVVVVDSLVPEYGGNIFNIQGFEGCIRVNISDIRDQHSLRALACDRELIFNLAGQTSHLDSMHDPLTDLSINGTAQLSLLEICRQNNPSVKIVFASTRQIYGRPQYLPVDEQHPLNPVDVNGINKLAGEFYHLLYNKVYGLRAAVLRLTNTYGPRMRIKDARQTFLGVWIRAVLEQRPIEVWGGEQLRDFTYVDDAVTALLHAAMNVRLEGQAFNLGGDGTVSLLKTAETLVAIGGGSFSVHEFPAERKRIDIGDYYADDRAFREVSGWRPKVSFEEGLRRTLEYYRHNLNHYL